MISTIFYYLNIKEIKRRLENLIVIQYKRIDLDTIMYNWDNIFHGLYIKPNKKRIKKILNQLVKEDSIKIDMRRSTKENPEYYDHMAIRKTFWGVR